MIFSVFQEPRWKTATEENGENAHTWEFHVFSGPSETVVGDAAVVAKVFVLHIPDGERVLGSHGHHGAAIVGVEHEVVVVPLHLQHAVLSHA